MRHPYRRAGALLVSLALAVPMMQASSAHADARGCVATGPGQCSYVSDGGDGAYAVVANVSWIVYINGSPIASGSAGVAANTYRTQSGDVVKVYLSGSGEATIADDGAIFTGSFGAQVAVIFNAQISMPAFPCQGCAGLLDSLQVVTGPPMSISSEQSFPYSETDCESGVASVSGLSTDNGGMLDLMYSRLGVLATISGTYFYPDGRLINFVGVAAFQSTPAAVLVGDCVGSPGAMEVTLMATAVSP